MDIENIKKLEHNIKKIFDKITKTELDLSKIKLDKIIHVYSNTNEPIYRLFYDNKCIVRNNKYCVIYTCIKCNKDQTTMLNNIIRKINKNIYNCSTCKEMEIEKRENHSLILKGLKDCKSNTKEVYKKVLDKLLNDENLFTEMDDDFKDNYFQRHLSKEEFDRIRDKIISFQNDRIILNNNYTYYPTVKISNQTRFNPYLYNNVTDTIEKIQYVKFNCEVCKNIFTNRDLYVQKNKYKILCQECNFTNNTFKIRTYKNCINEHITYQSKFELKFLKYCNENNIVVNNGPNIEYMWNNKIRKYRVDFYIPKINLLIEIKDNHIWHIENKNNGKWGAKLKGVKQFLDTNIDYNFEVIYPVNYTQNLKKIHEFYNI